MTTDHTKTAMLAAVGCYFIWGFTFLFSRLALDITTPFVLLMYRFLFAFLVMNLLLVTKRVKVNLKGKNLKPLLLLGIFEPVLYFIFEQYGILFTNTGFSGLMIGLIPIATLFFSSIILRERATPLQIFFSLLSIAGVIAIALHNGMDGQIRFIGIVLLVLTVISGSLFGVFSRKTADVFTSFERSYVMIALGLAAFIVLAVAQNIAQPYELIRPLASPTFLLCIAFLGGAASCGSYLLVNYSTTYLPVTRVTVFTNLTTAISVIVGVVFLRESFGWLSAISSVVIIVGIWGVQKFEKKI